MKNAKDKGLIVVNLYDDFQRVKTLLEIYEDLSMSEFVRRAVSEKIESMKNSEEFKEKLKQAETRRTLIMRDLIG